MVLKVGSVEGAGSVAGLRKNSLFSTFGCGHETQTPGKLSRVNSPVAVGVKPHGEGEAGGFMKCKETACMDVWMSWMVSYERDYVMRSSYVQIYFFFSKRKYSSFLPNFQELNN